MIKCMQKVKLVRLFLLTLLCVNGLLHAQEAQVPAANVSAEAPCDHGGSTRD